MVISHDREFLARTVTGIVELDPVQQQISVYDGGYEAYLVERDVARRHAREQYDEYADTKSALEDRAQMQRNWLEHGVRNARRKSKDNDKAGRKVRAESTEKQAAKARQTQRRIERLDVVEEPRKEWELRMSIAAAPRSGTLVASLDGAVVTRGGFTLGPVTTQVEWGDRIIVTGPNGAGKTTLLRMLLGTLTPDSGRATLGPGYSSVKSTRRVLFSKETSHLSRRSGDRFPTGPTPKCGRCSRSSHSKDTTCCDRLRPCHPAREPARVSHCYRHAG